MKIINTILIAVVGFGIAGCESKAGNGALIGGAGGAIVGGLIGSKSHARAGEGALIGGAAGAAGGALIGHSMDESDKKESRRDSDKRISKRDVIKWSNQGMRDDEIIDRIDRSRTVFRLSAQDQYDLRDAGVSESVIQAMKDTARR